jgi:NADH-quinone oxidoreductase subunit E
MSCHKKENAMEAPFINAVAQILSNHENAKTNLIEILHDIQETYSFLPEDALRAVSEHLQVPLIEVFRVANFYKAFSLKPPGRHLLTLCMGTACHVRGSSKLLDEVTGRLGIQPGETTGDGEITLETVNCLGACALGPVAILDGQYHDRVTFAKLRALIDAAAPLAAVAAVGAAG